MATDTFAEVKVITINFLGADESKVTWEARFREELEADSLDLVELTMAFEDKFGIEISDEDAMGITTVGEAVRYIDWHKGVEKLMTAWPEPKISRTPSAYKYDIAISYASEDRAIAEEIANHLIYKKVNVFYDRNIDTQADLWGKDLYGYFAELFSKRARYCLIIISSNYARKVWTRHELRAAQERALKESAESREYILPLRLDDTELSGVFSTTGYVDWREIDHNLIVQYLLAKLDEAG